MRRAAAALLAAAALWSTAPAAAAPATQAAPATRAEIEVRRDLEYGTAGGQPLLLDAYVPPPRADGSLRPAVVMIHGGGFRAGDKRSWEPEARRVAEKGWVAFSVGYRLGEPVVFPAAVDDVEAAVRWIRARAADFGVDPRRIGAVGESAGGTLAAMLGVRGSGPLDREARVKAVVAWSAPLDLGRLARDRGAGWGTDLFGCAVAACPQAYADASPISHVDPTDAPTFLITSEEDPVVPATQSYDMAILLEEEGVPVRLTRLKGERHALDLRDEMWGSTLNFFDTHLELDPRRSYGNVAFAVTVLVVATAAGVLLLRLGRRGRGAAGGGGRSAPRQPASPSARR